MKKTTRTARKVLSVFLAVLMMLTTWAVAVPGLVLAADGNKYYVKVYVNIYDGSDGYGGTYQVEQATGKPKNYSWVTNDGWYGRINMTGFTVFGEAGDYDAQDVSAALLEAEKLNTYYDMSGLSDNNANGDWDSKAIAKTEYTFVLDSFPVEIFWMNDENNWDGGNTGFAIRKLTVATSEGGTEHTMWEGLAGSDSETYNYYGSITPTGIHTCFEDYAKNYDMNDYKFYKAITSSSQRAWTDPYTYGSAGTYYLNEYANGGVSATFSEGATSVASTVDYIDTSSTDTYYVNYTNHSKTQIAEITGTYNAGNFVSSPYGIKLNPGETRSFEINKSNYSKLAKYNNAANFTFEYTLSNVYASDELNAPLAKFTQPTYIGLWNEANDSPKYITDEDGDGSTGYTLKMSDNYTWGNNSMTMTNTFQVTEGIIERNSATTGSGSNSVTFNYNYYVDVSNVSTWEDTGLRIYVTEDEYYRLPFQPKEYPSECGTITLSGNYANTDAASITIADIAFTNVTEDFWYSHSQASGYSTYGYYNQKGTPMWATQGKDAQATFYNNNPGWLRFAGTMIEPSDSSADPAKIVMDKMVYREDQNGQKAYFSGTINVYAFDKAELRDYIQKTLLDFAPMSLRYNTTAFETYQNKLASAMNVLANQKTTQLEVNNALSELKTAVAALQTTNNLINQVAELTHVQYVDDIGSEVAASIPERYVLVSLGEHTVPQNSAYIGNGTYKDATNKKSNLTTNYAKTDTAIETLKYYYWNIEFAEYDENRSVVDFTIENLETAIAGFDNNIYSNDYYEALVEAKEALEAIDQNDGTNSPSTQEEVETAIINADNLLAHLGVNIRAHEWVEDTDGNYVVEKNEDTHWYTCSICGYELVYNHYFEYEKIDDARHKATCVTSGTDEGCGYSVTEDHIWVEGETVASTCTAQGYTNYSCACGATKKDDYQPLKEHADVNPLDHNCDACGTELSQCADNNNDHKCDVCGATLSECADNNNDHNCDVCGDKLSDCADGNNDHKCDVCGDKLSDCTWGAPVLTTKPTETTDGEYTYTCEVCGGKKYVAVAREDYSAYDEAIKKAEELLENEDLTQAAKDIIEAAIKEAEKLDQNLPEDVVVDGETIIDNDSAEKIADATNTLNNVLNGIVDDEGNINDEYKKPDTSAAEKAVEDAEALNEKIELPEDVKTKIDELREELNGIIEEIAKDDEATEAEYKDELKAVEDAANAILEKYAACEKDGHKFGAEVIATYPVYDEASDTWSKGTYTKTCEVCGYVKTVAYDRANYEAYDKAVADLNSLLENENITAEAKAEINKVLTDNAIRYDLMTPDQSIVDAAVAKFVAEYNKITDENGNLKDEYKKPDSTAAEEAVEAAEGLKETVENLPQEDEAAIDNLRTELDKILEEIEADENPTDAEYQDRLDAIEEAAKDILEKYADCSDGHAWVEIDLARPTKNDDGTWNNGTYTYECENCKATKTEPAVRATYTEYDNAKAALEALLGDTTLTDTAKQTITDALNANKIADNLVATEEEQKIVDDAAAALKVTLGELTDENGNLKDEYKKPDYSEWDKAETAYDALAEEELANVKTEIIEEAEALKAEIAAKEANETLTQATATQKEIDDATARLKEIVAGIKDGTLVKPDYSGAEEAIEDAKEVADSENIPDDTEAEIEAEIAELEKQLNEIKDSNPSSTDEEVNNKIDEIEQAAKDIIDTYGECAKDNHTDVETDSDHNCDVCGKLGVTSHNYVNPQFTRPTQNDDGTWNNGYYTSTCNCGDTAVTSTIERADYEDYDKAVADLNALLETGKLTQTAVDMINDALEANDILDDYVATSEEQDIVDDAAAALKVTLGRLTDENGQLKEEYEKVDFTNYNAAVNAAEALKDVMTDEDKAAVEAAKKTVTDAGITDETSKADGQKTLDDAAAAIAAINAKYGDCADGNHNWGAPVLTKKPTADAQGEYTETCGTCGATQITKVDLADYKAFDEAVKALKDLANTENLTAEAAKAITDALEKAENLDKNLPADATTDDGKLIEGGQDEIDALVEQLQQVVANTNTAIGNGSALLPDYDAWNEAEGRYDALDKTNVKAEIITEAEALKAEIAAKEANETLTQATATQTQINDATTRLNEIVAGITDGSLKNPADFTEVDKDLADAKDKAENNNVVDSVKEDIKEIEEALNDLRDTATADNQDTIDELEDQLEEIIAGIENGSLIKDADFTEVDKDLADAKDKVENNNVVDGVKEDIKEIEDKINELKNDPATNGNDQDEIDALEKELEEIIAGIEDGSLIKPATPADYTEWDAAEKEYNELDKTRVKESIRVEVGELKISINTLKNDPATNAEDDQETINAKTARLNEIIAGIKDGSLKVPDYSKVDEKLDEAKDADNVLDETKTAIESIEKAIEDLKNNNDINAKDDQPAVDALEEQLDRILEGIEDGSLVKPDYSEADKAIADADKAIKDAEAIEGKLDTTLTDEEKAAIDELKKELEDIKADLADIRNDATSNKKDDQPAVDALEERAKAVADSIKEVSDKYAECLKGNHQHSAEGTVTEPTCTEQGYTTYHCTVCGKTFKSDFVPALGHIDEDDDGTCDRCHATDIYAGCACLCHNNHWFWRIVYMIIRIVWKIFGIHQVCACGRIHF